MKVLQLSTSLFGGAGIASQRAHISLRTEGVDSRLISLSRPELDPHTEKFIQNITRNRSQKLQSKALTAFQQYLVQKGPHLQTPVSLGINPEKFEINDFDVVHIHAMYNLVNTKTLKQILNYGKPTFITLHDQRFTSGGCHGSLECRNYKISCQKCPQVRSTFQPLVTNALRDTKQLLKCTLNKPTIIAPSEWIGKIAYEVFPEILIKTVYNCVEDSFLESNQDGEEFLNREQISIGFMALNLNNPYKDIRTLINAISLLDEHLKKKIKLILIGEGQVSNFPSGVEIYKTGRLDGPEKIKLIKDLDVMVIPSVQDNLPNVMCEALTLGVPVIGSNVGGIPEILRKFNLPIFAAGNHLELSSILNLGYQLRALKVDRDLARNLFSSNSYAKIMAKIYSGDIS
jgi:glycosyltransferase involved in cell wall biosynthesis